MISNFKDLIVWQKSIDLTLLVYQLTKNFPKSEDFGLTSQIRPCAVSIPSNIAEGHARAYNKEFLRFLSISSGSLAELETQIILVNKLTYISETDYINVCNKIEEISKMIRGLIKKIPTI
jgi:four helix bundle protein